MRYSRNWLTTASAASGKPHAPDWPIPVTPVSVVIRTTKFVPIRSLPMRSPSTFSIFMRQALALAVGAGPMGRPGRVGNHSSPRSTRFWVGPGRVGAERLAVAWYPDDRAGNDTSRFEGRGRNDGRQAT